MSFVTWLLRSSMPYESLRHLCTRHVDSSPVIKPDEHWFRLWLVTCLVPSHYLNQCWLIVKWMLRTLQWNSNRNTKFFIHENAFENVICEMAATLSRGRWVNPRSTVTLDQQDYLWIIVLQLIIINPLRAKFFRGNINIYLHFMSFLHIDLAQVLKILPQVREGPTQSI